MNGQNFNPTSVTEQLSVFVLSYDSFRTSKKDEITTLDYDFLSTVKTKAAGYIIYADLCTISDEELKKWNITFKKIPRDIAKV